MTRGLVFLTSASKFNIREFLQKLRDHRREHWANFFYHKKEHFSEDIFSSSLMNDKNLPQIVFVEKFYHIFSE